MTEPAGGGDGVGDGGGDGGVGVGGGGDTGGGGEVVQPLDSVQGWPLPEPPLLVTGSLPCVHQLAV